MLLMNRRLPRTRLLPLSLVMGICLASPAYADHDSSGRQDRLERNNGDGGRNWIDGGDDDRSEHDGSTKGPGPAMPEPSSWLAMGVGLLVVGRFLRRPS
jgi:hypothetical protein